MNHRQFREITLRDFRCFRERQAVPRSGRAPATARSMSIPPMTSSARRCRAPKPR